MIHYLNTGLKFCYNEAGAIIDCRGSGQDAEFQPGILSPSPRFEDRNGLVLDRLTGLMWSRNANPADFPLTWMEALEYIGGLNAEGFLGRSDWRLPNRREMRSLVDYQNRKPALPGGHPFENLFLGWYWTSTTAAINTAYAWYVHLEGGRMFYGKKNQSYLVWPVCGRTGVLPRTGQDKCYNELGYEIEPPTLGLDGELRLGVGWPEPRFVVKGDAVLDGLTNLYWTKNASLAQEAVNWAEAFDVIDDLNRETGNGRWRAPTINELETLVDARRHNPALPIGHPFIDVREIYVSSTTSGFEPDWCMLLHFHKGAVGVGQKKQKGFTVWAVSESL